MSFFQVQFQVYLTGSARSGFLAHTKEDTENKDHKGSSDMTDTPSLPPSLFYSENSFESQKSWQPIDMKVEQEEKKAFSHIANVCQECHWLHMICQRLLSKKYAGKFPGLLKPFLEEMWYWKHGYGNIGKKRPRILQHFIKQIPHKARRSVPYNIPSGTAVS